MSNETSTALDTSPRAVVERFLAANKVLDVDGLFEEDRTRRGLGVPGRPRPGRPER